MNAKEARAISEMCMGENAERAYNFIQERIKISAETGRDSIDYPFSGIKVTPHEMHIIARRLTADGFDMRYIGSGCDSVCHILQW